MMGNYHNRIMNIQSGEKEYKNMEGLSEHAYKLGHRDARHAAAEIALEAEREIQDLYDALNLARDYIGEVAKGPCDLGLVVMIDEALSNADKD